MSNKIKWLGVILMLGIGEFLLWANIHWQHVGAFWTVNLIVWSLVWGCAFMWLLMEDLL